MLLLGACLAVGGDDADAKVVVVVLLLRVLPCFLATGRVRFVGCGFRVILEKVLLLMLVLLFVWSWLRVLGVTSFLVGTVVGLPCMAEINACVKV